MVVDLPVGAHRLAHPPAVVVTVLPAVPRLVVTVLPAALPLVATALPGALLPAAVTLAVLAVLLPVVVGARPQVRPVVLRPVTVPPAVQLPVVLRPACPAVLRATVLRVPLPAAACRQATFHPAYRPVVPPVTALPAAGTVPPQHLPVATVRPALNRPRAAASAVLLAATALPAVATVPLAERLLAGAALPAASCLPAARWAAAATPGLRPTPLASAGTR